MKIISIIKLVEVVSPLHRECGLRRDNPIKAAWFAAARVPGREKDNEEEKEQESGTLLYSAARKGGAAAVENYCPFFTRH